MLITDEKPSRTSEGTLDALDRRTKDLEAENISEDPISDQDVAPASEKGKQKVDGDVLIVDWEGPDDPANPRIWPFRTKWAAVAIVSAFTFISPVVSSMIAPASGQVAREFGITSTVVMAMTTSVFVCAFAIGPLILSPLSEIFGRSRVLQLANLWFLAWNLGCGFAQNTVQLLVFRFLAGLGGSAPLSVSGGVIGDMFETKDRGQALALYMLAPLLGPVIGPVVGAWIGEKSTWRWVFYSTCMADAFVQAAGMLFLRETYPPVLLENKAARIRGEMSPEDRVRISVRTIFEDDNRHWRTILARALIRPLELFITEPIVQLFGVYMAFVYGLLYLFITTLPAIFQKTYHESLGISGLHYIALGGRLFAATQVGARMMDRLYAKLSAKNGGIGKPEVRLPTMYPGTVLLPEGLVITGWSAQNRVFWLVPDIGIALVGAGVTFNMLSMQTYTIDAFPLYAASALAATTFLRCLAGFGFPLFAPPLFAALGYGGGDTLLAGIALLAAPVPYLFWKYGEQIRGMSHRDGSGVATAREA